jgi:hypothetical protein
MVVVDEGPTWLETQKAKLKGKDLKVVDHSKVEYAPYRKDFYIQVGSITRSLLPIKSILTRTCYQSLTHSSFFPSRVSSLLFQAAEISDMTDDQVIAYRAKELEGVVLRGKDVVGGATARVTFICVLFCVAP